MPGMLVARRDVEHKGQQFLRRHPLFVAEHHSFRPADGAMVACRPLYLVRVSARLPQTWLKKLTLIRLAYQSRSPDFASSRRLKGTRFWSMRVSLANLPDEAYEDIGRGVRTIARGYRDAYEASKAAPKK